MAKAGITMRGQKKLLKKLKRLGPQKSRKIMRLATLKAMRPVVKDAKRRVPKETGLLKKSLTIKQKTYKKSGVIYTGIGAKSNLRKFVIVNKATGFGMFRKPAFYSHLVEGGTVHAAKQPFLLPAFRKNKQQIIARLKKEVGQAVLKATMKG